MLVWVSTIMPETTRDQEAPASVRSSILSSGHLGGFFKWNGRLDSLGY